MKDGVILAGPSPSRCRDERGPRLARLGLVSAALIGGYVLALLASSPKTESRQRGALLRSSIAPASTDRPASAGHVVAGPVQRAKRASDWRFRLAALAGIGGVALAVRAARAILWSRGMAPRGAAEKLLSYGAIFWALQALPAALALAGIAQYRGRLPGTRAVDDEPRGCDYEVAFRFVSRGRNAAVLNSSIQCLREHLASRPQFRHRIEVVTDEPVEFEPLPELRAYVVPPDYRTRAGTLYKARALQFALEVSDLADDSWIFHLDEESHVSADLIDGIAEAVAEEEASGEHRIGQGLILYHRNFDTHPVLTLADMIRSGEDIGRFHLQHRLGVALFGLHGSFILVRNSVERESGFDVGPEGSIAEDAFWALRQMTMGRRSRWVSGYLVEQSPESVWDFVRQRRRWFSGLLRVVLYSETKAWIRAPLALSIALWSVSWLGLVYTYVELFMGLRTGPAITALGDFALATYAMSYVIGLYVNLRDRPRLSPVRHVGVYIAQVALLPVFTLMEAAGVVLGVFRAERGFHVIKKHTSSSREGTRGMPDSLDNLTHVLSAGDALLAAARRAPTAAITTRASTADI